MIDHHGSTKSKDNLLNCCYRDLGKDITLNIRKQYKAMELGDVLLEELEIKQTLAKNPIEYTECTLSFYYS